MELRVVNVRKRYGRVVAVDGVSFTVEHGEIFGLIGMSGCGKSTLLRCIAGIERPDEGRIFFDGEDVTDLPLEERGIGFVFQDIRLFWHLTARENIAYAPKLRGNPEWREIVRWLEGFIRVMLDEETLPGELSRGAQQKISLARAIASEPRLLLLDEPLSGLDARIKSKMVFELRDMIKELGITTVYVTHDQWEILSVADRIAIMRAGRIVQIGTPEELYFSPANEYVAEFIGGECNFVEAVSLGGGEYDAGGVVISGAKEIPAGRKVLLAIKLDAIRLGGKYRARVLEREFSGPFVRLLLDVSGLKLRARVPSPLAPRGGELLVDFDRRKVIPLER